ncbi:MAG: DUF5615 family PIN-like protein, partial [Cytophagales bacterium]|nr:DUF5615 family PIN-like protein [Cytophagales bacterium]
FTDSTSENSVHVFWLPAGDETEDEEITRYADENDLIVVTKDANFVTSQILKSYRMLCAVTAWLSLMAS